MKPSRKDVAAATAVEGAIVQLFGQEPIDRIAVLPTEDHNGNPDLAVTVFLKADQERVSGRQLLDTIEAATEALTEIGDYRFPYVTFLAPEDECSEDTRPAA